MVKNKISTSITKKNYNSYTRTPQNSVGNFLERVITHGALADPQPGAIDRVKERSQEPHEQQNSVCPKKELKTPQTQWSRLKILPSKEIKKKR